MNNPKVAIYSSLFTIALIIAIVLLSTSFKKLTSTELGLEYDRIAKILDDAAKTGGLHIGPPGFKFIKFPSTFILEELPIDTCVSQDGLRVQFQVSFQYQMPEEWLPMAVIQYRDFRSWERMVQAVGLSAVQHSCSMFTISNFQNKRGVIQETMENNLRLKLEGGLNSIDGEGGVYARLVSVQLRSVKVPQAYTEAIQEKQSAEEDITLAINQRSQDTTKANTDLLAAKEDAVQIMDTANNEAEVVLTEAGLRAEEISIIFERQAEVIVGVKNALNLTPEGVLAYMSNQLIQSVPNLKVSMLEPSKSSRGEEL